MKKLVLFSLVTFTCLLNACNQGAKDSANDNEPILFQIKGDKGDPKSVYLWITDKVEHDSTFQYTVKGLYEKDTVGFYLVLEKDIQPGIRHDGSVDDKLGFQEGTVKFLRSGAESDLFVGALSKIWEVDSVISNFSEEAVIPLVFSSNKVLVDFSKPTTSNFKLFFDPSQSEPGEIFFTLDTYQRNVEFQEKDRKYAQTIVDALGGR